MKFYFEFSTNHKHQWPVIAAIGFKFEWIVLQELLDAVRDSAQSAKVMNLVK